jgi:hypothetical protein
MWPYLATLAVALAIVVAVPWLAIGFLGGMAGRDRQPT